MAKKQNTKQTNGGVAILRYARLSLSLIHI